ncbi:MAG: fructose-1,6-bisphosphatase [Oscillospiraceae bacterium]|nr:fructose-1,6-bisphosphatase [Oscillospiraceae bacterium]
MENKYLRLLARDYPTVDSVASEMVNLSAIKSLPKGTEYFFSDLHGEYESFLHMLRSASGMIRKKIDIVFAKTVESSEREKLATLIYYPEKEIKRLTSKNLITDEWRRLTIYRLILVCEAVSAKYTRSRIRKRVPPDLVYILDELLNVTDDINKDFYYDEIINTIIDTQIAESFIESLCNLIQSLAIDKLHIIGDIFDRGPRADIIMDELMKREDVDIQWGNHDISWMGAASGNAALAANVIRISMRYNSFDLLEDGYGLNLRALAVFAADVYKDDDCKLFYPNILDDNIYDPVDVKLAAKMHKAITIIQLKLEGQLINAHPEWNMDSRNIFSRVDFENGVVEENGKIHKLKDMNFPTVDKSDPLKLSEGEEELIKVLVNSFRHSEKLHKHMKFLFSHGSMYKICNQNLMFHGCIPFNDDGSYATVNIAGKEYCGKELLDTIDLMVDKAYFGRHNRNECYERDFMWYLWCGSVSPLYGKDKMAFFERIFLEDDELHKEHYNPYYTLYESPDICSTILNTFGIDEKKGHIINGHVPVKIKDGESPVKADGKLFVIDGGISKAYQSSTGIAGYTLIYDSHSLSLAEHKPFVSGQSEHTPEVHIVEKMESRVNVADTDRGKEISEKISDLRELLEAYRNGIIKER